MHAHRKERKVQMLERRVSNGISSHQDVRSGTIHERRTGWQLLFRTMKSSPTGPSLDNANGIHLWVFLLSLEQEMFPARGELRSRSLCSAVCPTKRKEEGQHLTGHTTQITLAAVIRRHLRLPGNKQLRAKKCCSSSFAQGMELLSPFHQEKKRFSCMNTLKKGVNHASTGYRSFGSVTL